MTRRAFLLTLLLPRAFRPAPRVDDRSLWLADLLESAANGTADPWTLAEAVKGLRLGVWGGMESGR